MRIFDEKHYNLLDSSHFRFIQLDENFIRFFYDRPQGNVSNNMFSIEFDSEEDAKLKFEEISKEVGWFLFNWNHKRFLLNTFCFCRFYVDSYVDSDGERRYKLFFWNNDNDHFSIGFKDKTKAIEVLKELMI